ncbi:MAG: HPP family protein [Acidimicrobiales bacterium]|nr:HPP family protein [Acidimicrobiales bacterium]
MSDRPPRSRSDGGDGPETPEPDARPSRPAGPGPIGGSLSELVFGLAERASIPSLTRRHDSTAVLGLFAFVNGVLSIALMSIAALVTGAPFIFPSLGPTAFLLFYTPTQPAASPRNTLGGHAIGAAAGYLSLVIFGLTENAAALVEGVGADRVGAAALSLGLTSGLMVWARVPHPPAGATTLIISLGILREPEDLLVLMLAVALLVVQAYVINHLAGIDYPRWSPRTTRAPSPS